MLRSFIQRAVAHALAFSLLLTLSPVIATAAFTDVKTSTQYGTAIEALQSKGVIQGYADGSFKPSQNINRAEFLKIALEANGMSDILVDDCFADVEQSDWFASYVCTAKSEGIVGGYPDGTFKPEQQISFVEAAKILSLAYGQEVQQTGGEWYEPYGRALESAKAIPTSISALDKKITRGEMAEMMWRISEKKTDQPSIGLLNVKEPAARVNFASDVVQTAQSCADIRAFLREQTSGVGYGGEVMMMDDAAVGAPAPMAARAESANQSKAGSDGDYSQTNVQVEGVDEGDIVKTDGKYLYIVRNGGVSIVQIDPVSSMKELWSLKSNTENFSASDLYIDGDTLMVIGNRWFPVAYDQPTIMEKRMAMPMIWPPIWRQSRTEVRIYNVANRSAPTLSRTVSFEAGVVSTRRINDKLYLVMNQSVWWGGPVPLSDSEKELMPLMSDSAKNVTDQPITKCAGITILPHIPSPQYLIVAVIPTNDLSKEVQKDVILGNAENVYASLENLYVAQTQWNYMWDSANPASNETTNVFRFAFTGDGVDMQAQGSVPGHILNQFSMDEHEETFRIATTIGQSWDSAMKSTNNLYVLNKRDMQTVGELGGMAPGESIYSVRFLGDRVYMVTFQKIDPLFVIDASDPRNPKILGSLKIPGYSDYLHPYDEDHIIGFGKEAVEAKEGSFAWYQGMKMAIFDVSDVSSPKEMFKEMIGDRGTQSPLLYNHKALLFEKERDLLAFPVTVHEIKQKLLQYPGQDPASIYGEQVFQGAYVYTIDLDKGFTLRGKITHYTPEDIQKSGSYFYGKEIERIVRSGDHLLTIGQAGVQSHSEDGVRFEGKVDLPTDQPYGYPMPVDILR